MKKIAAPNMEVILFTTEDVIVTSGSNQNIASISYAPNFGNGKFYATTGKELGEGGYSYSGPTWYIFQYRSKNEQPFTSIKAWDRDNSDKDFMYTWFAEDESTWRTESSFSRNYNKLPSN